MSVADAQAGALAAAPGERRPWLRAMLWLCGLGPFFFLSYGAANWLAAQHAHVGAVVYGWEHRIPFLPWTILPYWSIDAFYGLSLFVCTGRGELDRHARRLLTAQIIAVACFVLFPLRFTFPRPQLDGVPALLFGALASFDKPFNQAPSLHVALLVVLWPLYARHVVRGARWLLHLWFALVGVSVLTTYQHHFIDLPTGALLGFFCLWLWPERGATPLAGAHLARDPRRRALAARYAAGAAVLALPAIALGGIALWLLWPSLSLALVALNYMGLGAGGFEKGEDGRIDLGALALLAPYIGAAWVNSRLWTRHAPAPSRIADRVSLGRMPGAGAAARFSAVIDLCAELPGGGATLWHAFPMLDLVAPEPRRLREAAAAIEDARSAGEVLVCCALGFARSAAAVATWLVMTGRAATVDDAVATIAAARPRIVLDAAARAAVAAAAGTTR